MKLNNNRALTSIRSRLLFIILSVSTVTLLLAASMFSYVQVREYKLSLAENLTALGAITAENVKAALLFDDIVDATATLSELDKDDRIVNAIIFSGETTSEFASYLQVQKEATDYILPQDFGYLFQGDRLHILSPIRLDDGNGLIGRIYIQASLDSVYIQLQRNFIVFLGIIVLSLAFCFFLARHLQQKISSPILKLLTITKQIRDEKDYSLRVDLDDYREIGKLSDGFNEMLEEIASRDETLQKLASYDTLTGLANRSSFSEILHGAIKRGDRKNYQHAVMFLDLDRFKRINDSLGHTVGDELLIQVAHRLEEVLRGDDTVARLGGDEFTILLQEADAYQAAEVAERILDALKESFTLYGHSVVVTPSIGIVMFPEHGSNAEELMRNADTAMYKAKQAGGKNFCFFSRELTVAAQHRLQQEERLQHAVEKNEIILHYQPKLDLANGTISGVEALCRWNFRHEHLVPPNEFLPLADETGLIIPIGNEIFRKSINMVKRLNASGFNNLCMAINMSPRQIRNESSVNTLFKYIDEYKIDPALIDIEITEEALVDYTDELIATLKKMKDRGLGLAIDDFGTGYSSLSYLKKFPFDSLKIDMSFIRDIEDDPSNRDIVRAIIDMSHSLDLKVVAEGVETEQQLHYLREMHCDVVQGYLISRPRDEDKLWTYLHDKQKQVI